jgi:hypothetical protein
MDKNRIIITSHNTGSKIFYLECAIQLVAADNMEVVHGCQVCTISAAVLCCLRCSEQTQNLVSLWSWAKAECQENHSRI